MAKKPRRGRPPLKPDSRRSYKLSVTIREKLRRQLEHAAEEEGRTLSQEVEYRIEQSFDRGELIFDAMTLAYGHQLAGLVIAVARAMSSAGRLSGFKSGDSGFLGQDWLDDPFAYEQALTAAVTVLKELRPPGRPVASGGDAKMLENLNVLMASTHSKSWGEWSGKDFLCALRGEESTVNDSPWLQRVRELLSPVLERAVQRKAVDR